MATKKENSTAVALFGDKANIPAHLQTAAPLGNENVTSSDLKLPRLTLLQALSPEIRSVEGAKPGLLFNNITKELYESINVINLFFKKEFAIFKLRKLGGGLEGNYDTLAEADAALKALDRPEDYEIVETDKHYCLMLDETGKAVSPIAIYMNSTKLTISKEWNSELQLVGKGVDRFASVWNVSSFTQSNRRNEQFENFSIQFMGWAPADLYAEAKAAYQGFVAPQQQQTAAAA